MAHGTAKPTRSVLTGSRTGRFRCNGSDSLATKTSISTVPRRGIVTTAIVCVFIDIADQSSCTTLHTSMAGCGHTTYRNTIVVLARYRGKGNSLIEQTPHCPEGKVELLTPTPLVMSHATVQLGGFTVGETVVVCRIKFSTAVVVLHEITAEPQFIRKVTAEFKAARPGCSRWGRIVKIPHTGKIRGIGHVHRITDTHTTGSAGSLVKDLYLLILNLVGGKGKVIHLLTSLKCTEQNPESCFFITCKSHIVSFRMLYNSHFTAVQTYLAVTRQAD